MLVALAVTSMLVALLMGSLYYGTRVQASLADELGVREKTLRRADWFRNTLRSCLPADSRSGARFIATSSEIRCTTTAPLQAQNLPSPQKILWAIRKAPEDQRVTELVYQDLDDRGAPVVVQRFADEDVKFKFSGVNSVVVSAWPVVPEAPETIPRLIFLTSTDSGKEHVIWITAVLADPWLEQELKNPFGMELPR
ncbi:MAG: hypothetical protein KF796_06590 [Ramlibacter sp.]|nr:hypothetical protein [Ramlibacter sp.]